MLWYVKYTILNSFLFFVYFFPMKSIVTTRSCRLFGPWAVRAVVRWRVDVLVPALGAVICGHEGVRFRSTGGEMVVTRG